ncbi:MAG TPA: NADH-quinone oxidoreductase subunit NuoE [Steroidobacteraceae bacterium]|jgi:NADH-quinone oxidoreductase subunit E|nr:NADH-quinone oxidoreductase subunit NuoE [Steroidobacteraceae bacterium]
MSIAAATQSFSLHVDDFASIEEEMGHYADPRAASIGALKIVQKRHGWVPDAAIPAIGGVLGIPASDVESVATFYNLIFRRPVGRYVIKVCDSVACFLTGYEEVRDELCRQLGVGFGQTTPDGRFTLLPICCLGACDRGPTLMVNDETHFGVSPQDIARLLERYP